jgi:hypothetical protein
MSKRLWVRQARRLAREVAKRCLFTSGASDTRGLLRKAAERIRVFAGEASHESVEVAGASDADGRGSPVGLGEFLYLCLRLCKVRFENRVLRLKLDYLFFQNRVLRLKLGYLFFQNRVIRFRIAQTLLDDGGKRKVFEKVGDCAHFVFSLFRKGDCSTGAAGE